jgi:hypothetical protein
VRACGLVGVWALLRHPSPALLADRGGGDWRPESGECRRRPLEQAKDEELGPLYLTTNTVAAKF